MRFSSRTGDATKFEKIASPARAKNRSCGRGFKRTVGYPGLIFEYEDEILGYAHSHESY